MPLMPLIRLICAFGLCLAMLSSCADAVDIEPTVSNDIVETVWADTPDVAASPGRIMQLADDEFRLAVAGVNEDIAELEILHRDEPDLNRTVRVREGSVFRTLDYEVLVGTVSSEVVVVSWRTVDS